LRCSFPEILGLIKIMNRIANSEQTTALEEAANKPDINPFKVLITTILSQRTKDENTRKASNSLFSHYRNAASLANASTKHIEELIRPSGFYHVKARSIISVARKLVRDYNGEVPGELEKLLELPSVGRKTANCVLVYGFRIPAIPVDTHVHRIANRLAIVNTKAPEETELELRENVAQKYWLSLNEEFVMFGQRVCRPIRPRCIICKLRRCCSWYRSHRAAGEILWSVEEKPIKKKIPTSSRRSASRHEILGSSCL
jgi:endonuclease-3